MIRVSDGRRTVAKLRGRKKLAFAMAFALCLTLLAVSLWMVYSRPAAPPDPTKEELERPYQACIRRAEFWRARLDMDQTFRWFGNAIDCATTPNDRARASLEMGRLLLARAEKKTETECGGGTAIFSRGDRHRKG